MPGRELRELINGGLGFLYQPIHRLAGAVVAEAVLNVVELNGGVGGEADAAVAGAFRSADFAVAVLPAGGADNVAALDLHNLSDGGPGA